MPTGVESHDFILVLLMNTGNCDSFYTDPVVPICAPEAPIHKVKAVICYILQFLSSMYNVFSSFIHSIFIYRKHRVQTSHVVYYHLSAITW